MSTKSLIRKLEQRLDRYVGMQVSACGFEENIYKALNYQDKILAWLSDEIEKCKAEAVAESNSLNRGPG